VRVVRQVLVFLGLLSLVFGVIDHFMILGGKGAIVGPLGSPEGFLQFATVVFVFALVLMLSELLAKLEEMKPGGED